MCLDVSDLRKFLQRIRKQKQNKSYTGEKLNREILCTTGSKWHKCQSNPVTIQSEIMTSIRTGAEDDMVKSSIGISFSFISIYTVVHTYVYALVGLSVFVKG